jgi:hypothetical protein
MLDLERPQPPRWQMPMDGISNDSARHALEPPTERPTAQPERPTAQPERPTEPPTDLMLDLGCLRPLRLQMPMDGILSGEVGFG